MEDDADIPGLLRRPAVPAGPSARAAALLGGAETGAVAGLTLGELVYDRVSIDPHALEAFTFAHRPAAGDIHRLAVWARDTLDGADATVEGRVSRLQGYVFERMAASALRQGGAVVELPPSASNPGWDLRVNGEAVQAKCGRSPEFVLEHFARHPEVRRVVVNEELAAHFPGDDRVVAIGSVTRDLVRSHTDRGLHAAADMLDLSMLRFAPALSVIHNGWALWRQDTSLGAAAGNVAVDGAARFAGAVAGKALGAVASAALGGWPAVLAPVVLGTVGYRGGRAVGALVKRHVLLRAEAGALDAATRAWCAGCARVLGAMVDQAAGAGVRFAQARTRMGAAWAPLLDDWQERLAAEQAYRRLHQGRFGRAAADLRALGHAGEGDPLAAASAAMLAASRAGLLPSDLPGERVQLTAAAYAGGLRRRLLA